ncbi:unnamed protein product [Ixodes persulcatus]
MKCLLIPMLPRRCSLCFSHLAKNTDDIADILSELKLSAQQEKSLDESALLDHLKKLLDVINADDITRHFFLCRKKTAGQDQTQVVERLARGGFASTVKELLKLTSTTRPEVLVLLVQAIAEAAKNDVLRKLCSDPAVIEPLLGLVSSSNYGVVLQACRALGNICYDNGKSFLEIVRSKQGMEQLLQLLQNLLEVDVRPDNLHTVVSGCLLNLTDMQGEFLVVSAAIGICFMRHQLPRLFSSRTYRLVCLCLASVSLSRHNCGRKHLLETRTLSLLLANLDRNFSVEVIEVFLELFGNLAENDSVKENLAQLGFCEKLLNVLRQFQGSSSPSEEKQNVVKTVCDLIVLILTGDASMRHMYQNGSGAVYKTTVSWLQSDDDTLKVAGALATGNFARKDDHCIQMVRDGVARRLLDLLNDQTGNDGDIRLQHALLAALRNLAIPCEGCACLHGGGVFAGPVWGKSQTPLLLVPRERTGKRADRKVQKESRRSVRRVRSFLDEPKLFECSSTLSFVVRCAMPLFFRQSNLEKYYAQTLLVVNSACHHDGRVRSKPFARGWVRRTWNESPSAICKLISLTLLRGGSSGSTFHAHILFLQLPGFCAPVPSADIAVEELKKTEVVPLLHTLLVSPDIAPEPLLNSIALTTALSNLGPLKPMLAAGGFKEALTQLKGHYNQTVSRAAAQALEVLEKP